VPNVSEPLRDAIARTPEKAEFYAGHLDLAQPLPPDFFRFAGWAHTPIKQAPADYVVLGWQSADGSFHPFTAMPTGKVRRDVAELLGESALKTGFDQDIETARLPAEVRTIKAWAIDWQTQQAFPVDGALQLDRPHS